MYDYHMHTAFSADCKAPAEEMVRAAIKKGLNEICFTDHVDYDYPDPDFIFEFDQQEYRNTIAFLQDRYGHELSIKRGVEIGVQPHVLAKCGNLVEEEQFDFVLCSLHTVEKQGLHSGAIFKGRTTEEAFEAYYKDLRTCLQTFDHYNVLGHVDLIKRYADLYPSNHFHDALKDILTLVISRGKGIEINTSGVRYGLPTAMPSPDILKLYKECGGEIVTIGSDAHRPSDIGYDICESMKLAEDIGFRFITTFTHGKPQFHSIEQLLR